MKKLVAPTLLLEINRRRLIRNTQKKRSLLLFVLRIASVVVLAMSGTSPAAADTILYATQPFSNQISAVDITTNTITPVILNSHTSDGLIFAPNGNIVYTGSGDGTVHMFNPVTKVDTVLATGMSNPADLTLEPGGTSVLVSDRQTNKINRVLLSGGGFTTLASLAGNPFGLNGLAYDDSGRLFAVSQGSVISQINPSTGAVLNTSSVLAGVPDGLTFDSFTHKLYAAANGGQVYAINPTTLATTQLANASALTGTTPDGLTSDGAGNLYIATFGDMHIYQYDLVGQTLTQRTFVTNLDDLAPLSGPGALTPEPASITLLGIGIAGMAGYAWRRLRQ